jgi:RNA-directed DNA polymerase
MERYVLKLQKRIYLASKEKDIPKVRQLQHTLLNSYYAKLLAVRCVRTSPGKLFMQIAEVDGFKFSKATNPLSRT